MTTIEKERLQFLASKRNSNLNSMSEDECIELTHLLMQFQSEKIEKLKDQRDELLAETKEIIAISDRKHDAWDRAKAVIANIEGGAA